MHTGLDIVGLIPGVGEIADGANALIYLAEGDKVNAALSAASMLPVGGQAATAAKWGKKGVDAAQATSKAAKAEQKVATRAAREGAEEGAQAGAKGGKKSGGGKDKGKKKLKCGEYGKYGDLKKKTGDGKFDRDHIPSKAALKAQAEELLGRRLKPAEARAIDKAAAAVAIPRQAHIDVSPTYGQKLSDAAKDAGNLAGSARRDVEAMLKEIDKYDEDGGCKKAYQRAAAKILRMSNKDYNDWLMKIVKGVGK